MSGFDEALAKARTDKQAVERAKELAVAAEAARRDAICAASRQAALALLPELNRAVEALQAKARYAEAHPDISVPWAAPRFVRRRSYSKPPKFAGWTVGVKICVPISGRPTAMQPSSHDEEETITLESFADEGHWWFSTFDSSLGTRNDFEWDAAHTFQIAIEGIARYLAQIE
jgi:hypothetical protein